MIFKPFYNYETGRASYLLDEFIDALSDVPPKPAEMEQILRVNQGRLGISQ